MAYNKGGIPVFLCSIMLLHFSQSSPVSVPLLTWSHGNAGNEVQPVTAGQTKELSHIYKEHFHSVLNSKAVILVFVQDELSADDFTKYGSSFEHLQNVLQKEKYLLYPSVSKEKEESIIQLMEAGSASKIEYVDSGSLSDWKFKALPSDTVNKIIVFTLEPVSGSHSKGKREILKRNDLLMHRIIKSLKEQLNDVAIVYTAEDPSPIMADILTEENLEDSSLISRHLLAADVNETRKYFNNSCVMMYATSIKLTMATINNTVELISSGAEWVVDDCGANSCGISITRKGDISGDFANITVSINFMNNTQEWYCESIQISGTHKTVKFMEEYSCGLNTSQFSNPDINSEIRAPMHMSYACQDMAFAKNSSNLTMSGLQMQTLCDGKATMQFRGAFNCVGFFTIEILTGIFVTVILMMGLYVGIMMIMAIQVQDRLDDPKGKSITVPTRSE